MIGETRSVVGDGTVPVPHSTSALSSQAAARGKAVKSWFDADTLIKLKDSELVCEWIPGNTWFGMQPGRKPGACTNVPFTQLQEREQALVVKVSETAEVEPRSCLGLERGGFRTNTTNYYSTKQAEKKWNMSPLKATQTGNRNRFKNCLEIYNTGSLCNRKARHPWYMTEQLCWPAKRPVCCS